MERNTEGKALGIYGEECECAQVQSGACKRNGRDLRHERDKRPSPKELLEQLQAEEERIQKKEFGRLKIFLGFAAGTGKTYAMLEAAQDLKRQGVDVVAGYVEPHRRAETAAMEQGLEKLPFLMVDYKGN